MTSACKREVKCTPKVARDSICRVRKLNLPQPESEVWYDTEYHFFCTVEKTSQVVSTWKLVSFLKEETERQRASERGTQRRETETLS